MTGAFLLCATFEVMGLCEGFGAYRYSRRLTPCGRGLMAPPGLTALGAKGSACERLRLTGRLRAPPSGGMKHRCAGEVRRPWGRQYKCRLWRRNRTTGHMDKPQWGLRVDGPSGRRFLRGLSLTRLWREGCCGRLILLKAPFYNKTFTTGLRPLENHTTALRAKVGP